jgi:hypothetical protein
LCHLWRKEKKRGQIMEPTVSSPLMSIIFSSLIPNTSHLSHLLALLHGVFSFWHLSLGQ